MSANTLWNKSPWDPEQWTKGDKGVWITGRVTETRFHTVTTKDALHRFLALKVNVGHSFERTWNQYGNEQTPDWRKPERSVNKQLTHDALFSIIKLPDGLVEDTINKKNHPHVVGHFELWADPDLVKGLKAGTDVLVKTEGGFFVKWISNNTPGQVSGNLSGKESALMGAVGGIMAGVDEAEVLKQETMEGCAEEEWDD